MVYPHKWSPISYRSSAGQRKHAGQRSTLYLWTTQPTVYRILETSVSHDKVLYKSTATDLLIRRSEMQLPACEVLQVVRVEPNTDVGLPPF